MADNKVNMSLDEIIKSERKNKRPGRKGVTRNIKKGRMAGGRPAGGQGRGGRRRDIRLNAATVSAVNKLVKKAISQRANQQLIRRAANRRVMANRGIVATRPAGFLARRSYNIARPSGLGRLRGINQRSRVIRSAAARRAQQEEPLVLSGNVKTIRGRGSSRLGQLVSDDAPVYVRREVVPVEEEEEEEILEEAPPRRFQFPRRRRQVIVQQRRRPIVVERRVATRPVVTYVPVRPNRGIAKRNTRTRFVNVSNSPIFERVQRQQNWRSRRGAPRQFVNPNVAQMREALGIGRQVERIVERFEPSSSFLQRVPATKRKGRGFQPRF